MLGLPSTSRGTGGASLPALASSPPREKEPFPAALNLSPQHLAQFHILSPARKANVMLPSALRVEPSGLGE